MTRLAGLAALALCACDSGTTGTVVLTLVTSPDSHVLDRVETMRLTITHPRQVTLAARTSAGFELALEFDAMAASGAVIVEGLDASGALIACGQSPAFPVSAINSKVAVYVAPPRSVTVAPAVLDVARSEVAATPLSYGAVIAGGRDLAGAPSSAIAVYNAYVHTMVSGIPLLAPRAGLAMATGVDARVYLFGGTGADGNPTGTLWRFDTTVAPNGAYAQISDQASFARTGEVMVALGSDQFLVTGTPALLGTSTTVAARSDIAGLPPAGATATQADGTITSIFAGEQLVRYQAGAFSTLAGTGRDGASAAALPDGRIVVVGGGDPASRDLLAIDASGQVTTIPGALVTARTRPSVIATQRHLVIAGGSDATGAPIATAEILDAATLAPIATLPILARTGAAAIALPTDQVLLVGGTPASAQLELFTPEPPPAP